MTAVNVLVLQDSAVIVTDTLGIQPSGRRLHAAKCIPLPHMKLALATRGTLAANGMFARLLALEATDFESARAFLDRRFRELSTITYDDMSENHAWKAGVELFVAGWSKNGPAAFTVSTLNTGYRVQDIPYVATTPTVPQHIFKSFADDPIANMPALLAAQAKADHNVGGFMNVTHVGEREIVTYTAGAIPSPIVTEIPTPEPKLPEAFAKHLRKP